MLRNSRENYDPSKPVCDSQDDFNQAVGNALDYRMEQNMPKEPWLYVYVVLWLIFLFWAVMLALKVEDKTERIEHLVLAMVFSPIYIISYYLNNMKQRSSSGSAGRSGGMGSEGSSAQFGFRFY